MTQGYSTYEQPIRQLIKRLLQFGFAGFIAGLIAAIIVCHYVDLLKPNATQILVDAFVAFHMTHWLLIPIYAGGSLVIFLIYRWDRAYQKRERMRRAQELLLMREQKQ